MFIRAYMNIYMLTRSESVEEPYRGVCLYSPPPKKKNETEKCPQPYSFTKCFAIQLKQIKSSDIEQQLPFGDCK